MLLKRSACFVDLPELLRHPWLSETFRTQSEYENTVLEDHLQGLFVVHGGVGRGRYLAVTPKFERLAKSCPRNDVEGKRSQVISSRGYSLS